MNDAYSLAAFAALNRRYARSLDGKTISYDYSAHVVLEFDTCLERLEGLRQFLDFRWKRGLRNSKEVMLARIVLDQLQKVLTLWQAAIDNGPCFGFNSKQGTGFLVNSIDTEICDQLDTLVGLNDAAVRKGIAIAGYMEFLPVKTFLDKPCDCESCTAPSGYLPWLWHCAQEYHSDIPPAIFERVFGSLRDDVAAGLWLAERVSDYS